ncbi:5'-3' exoribonuclease 2 homolog [Episyrphus balteatus]|uniref:5'-3' exoribonuclease 2 homolog n=1 Tax=Episyrphus balteatus TaxID=286459 RepID=UPI002486BA78|nr:5'-3' exoribonuclease 2 homolog [Episyrphus balteatus]
MGVPAFFRWLSRKYPSVIVECVENKTVDDEGRNQYEDPTLPNPNGIEFDNLYLDMNGIIHPCTHPEDKPPPRNEDEMMVAIFECIDRLFGIVRPRKLLYMAIDGVAPRAKMNQQRSRRFRAAKESVEKRIEMERVRNELLAKGCVLPPEKPKEEHFDSNCITPGTPFMQRLSVCLSYYIHERMNNNPAWKGIKVILSDANVPGEGEHKIMDYVRKQRAQPDHDPNTQHVLCGADADLIMLGLATHEPNFTIIREEFLPNKPRPCDMCGQFGHELDKCEGLNATYNTQDFKPDVPVGQEVKFIFVRLNVLREYLKRTLQMPSLPFKYDFDRALDDWVFMCFFVGNDFLPHLPSLEIREGAVDRLVELYKKCVYKTGGYITDSGEVNLDRVQLILNDLGNAEDQIFKDRQKREKQFQAREKAKKRREGDISAYNNTQFAATALGRGNQPGKIDNYKEEAANVRNQGGRAGLDALLRPQEAQQQQGGRGQKRTADQAGLDDDDDDEQKHDEVRLWEDGFKDRYYESKFDVGPENLEFRYSVALQYVRGLSWVLKYYYQGCASWKWYFPYHYAPFASDFKNIAGLSTAFEKGTKPFNPLEQLMGVFPAASSSHVPAPWATLMSDPKSTIIDFYPEDFKIDLNGKKFAWQGVALLPFVDERRLFKALKPYYPLLTDAEVQRNKCGDSRLYISTENDRYKTLKSHYKNNIELDVEVPISIQGMGGLMLSAVENIPLDGLLQSPIKGLLDISGNVVITVRYRDPKYDPDYIFPAVRLPNAVDPPNVLGPEDREEGYRPQIGFTRNSQRGSLGAAGHRMVNNYTGGGGNNRDGGNNYAQIAPPNAYNDRYNSNQQRSGNNYNNYQQGGNNYKQYGGRGGNSGGHSGGGSWVQVGQEGGNRGGRGRGGNSYNNQQRHGNNNYNNNYGYQNNRGGGRGGYNNNHRRY